MAKKITKKVEKEEVSHAGPVNETIAEKKEVAEPKVEAPKEVAKLPATAESTGKFYALEVKGGAVIINPNGQRVSKLMTLDKAGQDAQRMNK
jgi:hypothetical protein